MSVARVDAAVSDVASAASLTAREREVLAALAAGGTAEEIARELRISPRTLHKHLEHVYRKLGVTHRGAATARVLAL